MPNTETVLAVAGLLTTAVFWGVERYLPGRKRIGYRVQMDTAIGMNPQDAHALVQLRLLREDREIADATLALLRIENDGSKDIVRQDYQDPLSVEFPGRTIIGVEVPDASPQTLVSMLTRNGTGTVTGRGAGARQGNSLRYDGGRLTIPPVPLNKRNHFKLLVLLTGTGTEVRLDGFISGGRVSRNTQRRGPRRTSLALGSVFIILVGLLGGLLLNEGSAPAAAKCATGKLAVDGSTAFAPLMSQIGRVYEAQCPGARISVSNSGSLSGIRNLESAGKAAGDGSPARIAVSDGPAPAPAQRLEGVPAGVVIFSVVVNKKTGIHDLSLTQLREIYAGKHTNWKELGGSDEPISLVSRDAGSGTRKVFQETVLKGAQEPSFSSDDCVNKNRNSSASVIRCELDSTSQLLDAVGRVPGAIGYTETAAASRRASVVPVQLGGRHADIVPVEEGRYPFWTVEYLYTFGRPAPGSLTAKFLAFMDTDTAKNIMRTYGPVPCVDRQRLPERLCRP